MGKLSLWNRKVQATARLALAKEAHLGHVFFLILEKAAEGINYLYYKKPLSIGQRIKLKSLGFQIHDSYFDGNIQISWTADG